MRRLLAHESLGGDCGAVLPVGPRLSSYRIPAASPARGSQGPVLPRHRWGQSWSLDASAILL